MGIFSNCIVEGFRDLFLMHTFQLLLGFFDVTQLWPRLDCDGVYNSAVASARTKGRQHMAVLLKVWVVRAPRPAASLEPGQQNKLVGSTPDLLTQNFCGWGPGICRVTGFPGGTYICQSLRGTDLWNFRGQFYYQTIPSSVFQLNKLQLMISFSHSSS